MHLLMRCVFCDYGTGSLAMNHPNNLFFHVGIVALSEKFTRPPNFSISFTTASCRLACRTCAPIQAKPQASNSVTTSSVRRLNRSQRRLGLVEVGVVVVMGPWSRMSCLLACTRFDSLELLSGVCLRLAE